MPLRACLFDIGGVVVRSPMLAIFAYEKELSMPPGYINYAIAASSPNGAWQQIERNEVPLDKPFFDHFTRDIMNQKHWEAYHRKKGLQVPPRIPQVDGEKLFWNMMEKARELDPVVANSLPKLREAGFKVGALTNDYKHPPGTPQAEMASLVSDLFDVVVRSSEEGTRKPEERFYRIAMERLGVEKPEEIIFLDDIGTNLRAAREIGFKTIKVDLDGGVKAIRELEQATGVQLLEREVTSRL